MKAKYGEDLNTFDTQLPSRLPSGNRPTTRSTPLAQKVAVAQHKTAADAHGNYPVGVFDALLRRFYQKHDSITHGRVTAIAEHFRQNQVGGAGSTRGHPLWCRVVSWRTLPHHLMVVVRRK